MIVTTLKSKVIPPIHPPPRDIKTYGTWDMGLRYELWRSLDFNLIWTKSSIMVYSAKNLHWTVKEWWIPIVSMMSVYVWLNNTDPLQVCLVALLTLDLNFVDPTKRHQQWPICLYLQTSKIHNTMRVTARSTVKPFWIMTGSEIITM